jgi:glycine cleavage system aminomethyltransferase T
MAYLPIERTAAGTRFEVAIRGRGEPALVVPKPFYKRPKLPST